MLYVVMLVSALLCSEALPTKDQFCRSTRPLRNHDDVARVDGDDWMSVNGPLFPAWLAVRISSINTCPASAKHGVTLHLQSSPLGCGPIITPVRIWLLSNYVFPT